MGKAIDLTGQTFGRWTVLYKSDKRSSGGSIMWHCRCSCPEHNEKDVDGNSLRRGKSQSCGCLAKESASKIGRKRLEDLTGQHFGRLTVIEMDLSKTGRVHWLCKCNCEKETIVSVAACDLKSGHTQSCGCYHWEQVTKANMVDIKGQKFGSLIALEPTKERSGTSIKWKCYCTNCGRIKNISANALRRGVTVSCGCIQSKGELKVSQILDNLKIKYESQKKFDLCKNPETNYKLPFDFYLPQYNAIIEYNGEQHYIARENGVFTKDKVDEIQKRDLIKKNFCIQNNIKYIEIPYTDYNILDKDYLIEKIHN